MSNDESLELNGDRLFTNPWPALITGLIATALAWGLASVLSPSWMLLWIVFLIIGLAATGAGVAIEPQSPGVLGLSAFVALLANLVADKSQWGFPTMLLFGVMMGVAGAAALLMMMPQAARRAIVSFLIIFHFGGLLTAAASAPPQPWIAGQLWTYVYRPYLQFVYLNNAYHFYSPEPGPSNLLWARLEYEPDPDGTKYSRWVKIPELDDDGRVVDYDALGNLRRYPKVEFTRRLSLVESISSPGPSPDPATLTDFQHRRMLAGQAMNIPIHPAMLVPMQYREPHTTAKIWLASYARHIARTYKHKDKPEKEVTGVKMYRVSHQIIMPTEFGKKKRGINDPSTYHPYYLGEYDRDGKIKPECCRIVYNAEKRKYEEERDPFLYWLIPIVPVMTDPNDYSYPVKNYLKVHAGDAAEGANP